MDFRERKSLKTLALNLWPKIFFSKKRNKFKNQIGEVTPEDRALEQQLQILKLEKESISPYVFMRVKNEATTLPLTLKSIEPILTKGVIGYNECNDGSEEIILNWCREHPGFVPFKYPYSVIPAGSIEYTRIDRWNKNSLAAYYNAVLEIIPKNEWILKIDADQIYFPNILRHSFSLPKNELDWVSYSRLDLLLRNNNFYVLNYRRPGDHFLIYNRNIYFDNISGLRADGTFFAYEMLKKSRKLFLPWKPECSSIHLPFEKNYRSCSHCCPPPVSKMSLESFLDYCNKDQFSSELISEIRHKKTYLVSKLRKNQ